jgi:hypothetical protein
MPSVNSISVGRASRAQLRASIIRLLDYYKYWQSCTLRLIRQTVSRWRVRAGLNTTLVPRLRHGPTTTYSGSPGDQQRGRKGENLATPPWTSVRPWNKSPEQPHQRNAKMDEFYHRLLIKNIKKKKKKKIPYKPQMSQTLKRIITDPHLTGRSYLPNQTRRYPPESHSLLLRRQEDRE